MKENLTKRSQWIKWLPKYLARWAEGSSFYSQVLGNKMKAVGLLRLRNKRWGGASAGFSRTDSGNFKKKLPLIAGGTAKEVKKQVKFLSSHPSTLLLGCHTARRLATCKVLAMYISQQQLQNEVLWNQSFKHLEVNTWKIDGQMIEVCVCACTHAMCTNICVHVFSSF